MTDFKATLIRYIKRVGAGSMLISIIIHVIVLICATLWVVSSVQPQRKANFQGGGASPGPSVQHAVKMANSQPKLDTLTRRLVVESAASSVTLPDLPVSGGASGPGSISGGSGLGGGTGGAGAGIGNLKAPIMPLFGFKEPPQSGSLVGSLYLFPKNEYKDNGAESREFRDWFTKFKTSGWAESGLARLKKSSVTLYSTQITIPNVTALEAPKAFGVPARDSKVRFLICYKAKIVPPRPGSWRFVGYGDDVLVVKIDGRVVLESSGPWGKISQPGLSGWTPSKVYKYSSRPEDTYTVGDWVQFTNTPVSIEIYHSEEPSVGETSAVLLAEEQGASYAKTANNFPILPIWTLLLGPKIKGGKLTIPVASEAPVWQAKK